MSWLSFNESLNNLKGHLTTLATSVLQDDEGATSLSNEDAQVKSSSSKDLTFQNEEESNWSWGSSEAKTDETKATETISDLRQIINQLEKEKLEYSTTLEQLDVEYQGNMGKLFSLKEKLEAEYKQLQLDYSSKQEECESYKHFEQQLYDKIAENKNMQFTIEELNSQIKELKIKNLSVEEKNANSDESFQQLVQNTVVISNSTNTETENKNMQLTIDELTSQIEELRGKNLNLEEQNVELDKLVQQTVVKNAATISKITNTENENKNLQSIIDELTLKIEELKEKNLDLKDKNAKQYELIQQTVLNNTATITKSTNTEIENDNMQLKLDELTSQIKELKEKNLDLEDKNAKQNELIQQTIVNNTATVCKSTNTEIENDDVQLKLDELTSQIKELKEKNLDLEDKNAKQNELIQDTVVKHTATISKSTSTDIENENMHLTIDLLTSQIKELKEKNLSLENENAKQNDLIQQIVVENTATVSKSTNTETESYYKFVDKELNDEVAIQDKSVANMAVNADFEIIDRDSKLQAEFEDKSFEELKLKCDELEKRLFELSSDKTRIMFEKNEEIEKLINNSEILSQEILDKSQTLKDLENKISELETTNDVLITELEHLKNSTSLQTISESNEDNMLLLEGELDTAKENIQSLLAEINELRNFKTNNAALQTNFENLQSMYNDLLNKYDIQEPEINELKSKYETCLKEKQQAEELAYKFKSDLENLEYQVTELNVNTEVMKEENENYKKELDEIKKQNILLNSQYQENESVNGNVRYELDKAYKELSVMKERNQQLEFQVKDVNNIFEKIKAVEQSLKGESDKIKNELLNEGVELNLETKQILKRDNIDDIPYSDEYKNLQKCESEKMIESQIQLVEKQINVLINLASFLLDTFKETKINLENTTRIKVGAETNFYNLLHFIHQCLCEKSENQENSVFSPTPEAINSLMQKFQLITHQTADIQKISEEVKMLRIENHSLKEKCESLSSNLLDEQSNVQKLLREKSELVEKEMTLTKKLDRLQVHLIEIEEHYTQELLQTEQLKNELQHKFSEIEERERKSSSLYTSVNIRANQQVETLQSQLQSVITQRDDLKKKLIEAEERNNDNVSALANLHVVLQQFQKDKEIEIQIEIDRVRKQVDAERQIQSNLRSEIAQLKRQLEESNQGLLAASRLSDQLETAQNQIISLKEEVSRLQNNLTKREEKIDELSKNSEDKIEKMLIKNLVISLLLHNKEMTKEQTQIMKIISSVLDFTEDDHHKISNKASNSWLNIFTVPDYTHKVGNESLTQEFVKFLQHESNPRVLPNINNEPPPKRKVSEVVQPSSGVLSEILLPTLTDFAESRNSSSILKDVLKENH